MRRGWTLILLLAVALGRSYAQIPVQQRVTCGISGLNTGIYPTRSECLGRGCEYDQVSTSPGPLDCYYPGGSATEIKDVILVISNHFDAGFVDTTVNIINRWFTKFFPMAGQMGAQYGKDKFQWMAQSWLVYLYMNCPPGMGISCPNEQELANFTASVKSGYITYHALPANLEPEAGTSDLLVDAVLATHALDDMFGVERKKVASVRDVPGITAPSIPALLSAGVEALSIGVNGASTAPNLPRAFQWQDPQTNKTLLTMQHPRGYGGEGLGDAVVLPGVSTALMPGWNGDNDGPPPPSMLQSWYKATQAAFPNATIRAGTFEDFLPYLQSVASKLPVLRVEMGDTWSFSFSSAAPKNAKARSILRARKACEADPKCAAVKASSAIWRNHSMLFSNYIEHTLGFDDKTVIDDFYNYTNPQFHRLLAENASNIEAAITALEQIDAFGVTYPLQALQQDWIAPEDREQYAVATAAAVLDDWNNQIPPSSSRNHLLPLSSDIVGIRGGDLTVMWDATTGALTTLNNTRSGSAWATSTNPLASFLYRTLSADLYSIFLADYSNSSPPPSYLPKDFTKFNLSAAQSTALTGETTLTSASFDQSTGEIVLHLALSNVRDNSSNPVHNIDLHTDYGAPASLFLRLLPPPNSSFLTKSLSTSPIPIHTSTFPFPAPLTSSQLGLRVVWEEKTPTRLPESFFLRFHPSSVPQATNISSSYRLSKCGGLVDPVAVQLGGGKHQHGVDDGGVRVWDAADATLDIQFIDTSVVQVGYPLGLPTPYETVVADSLNTYGVAAILTANVMCTNTPQWQPWQPKDANMALRFVLDAK